MIALSLIVNGKSGISPEMAIRLTKAFGSTEEAWLRMQLAYDLAAARKKENKIKVRRQRIPEKLHGPLHVSKADADSSRVNLLPDCLESTLRKPPLNILKQDVFFPAYMPSQQLTELLQPLEGRRGAELIDHAFKSAMVGNQFHDNRHFSQFPLDHREQKLLLDAEVIGQFNFVAVNGALCEFCDIGRRGVGAETAFRQYA
jgi:hypothetical protein